MNDVQATVRPTYRARNHGGDKFDRPVRRTAVQMDQRGGRVPEGLPQRHDRLQPAATALVRPAHVSGFRVRIQRPDHGGRAVQRVRVGHRGPETVVLRRSRLRVRGQPGRHRYRRVRVRVAHIADGVAGSKLDIRTVYVLFPADAPGQYNNSSPKPNTIYRCVSYFRIEKNKKNF